MVSIWCCFRGCCYYSFLSLYFITKFFKSCFLGPFSTNISIEKFSSFLNYFSKHIECALWRKPLNTFSMAWGSMYVFLFVVNGVSNINIQEIQRFISVFILYGVLDSWFLFVWISWKVFTLSFYEKRAWLSSTYRLNVFNCMCIARASAIALRSRWCK